MKELKMWKKSILVLVFFESAVAVFAQTEADFQVRLTNDNAGAVIIKYTGMVAVVRIPASIQGFPVKEIGNEAFNGNKNITSVIIPEGVTVIRGNQNAYVGAFKQCEKLVQVTLPSTLKSIGAVAFGFCPALRDIVIPEGVTQIEHSAFRNCSAMTSLTLPSTIQEIGEWAFEGCSAMTTVTIPESVRSIRFIIDNNKSINNTAFGYCTRLSLSSQAALRRRGYTGTFEDDYGT
jgi:hypothetical protein